MGKAFGDTSERGEVIRCILRHVLKWSPETAAEFAEFCEEVQKAVNKNKED